LIAGQKITAGTKLMPNVIVQLAKSRPIFISGASKLSRLAGCKPKFDSEPAMRPTALYSDKLGLEGQ
jgi:hypothetical protein